MRRTRSSFLSIALTAALLSTSAAVSFAETAPPPTSDAPVATTAPSTPTTPTTVAPPASTVPAEPAPAEPGPTPLTPTPDAPASAPADDPLSPAPTTTLGPVTPQPAAPESTTEESAPAAPPQTAAVLAEAVTNLPSLAIDLPPGYDLADLNATKDPIPADPDTEPHAVASLVDPADSANDLVDVTLEEIKGRGNFTWRLEKKPYQIKFDTKTAVLGMPASKTWILLANHADASLLRNKVAYDLAIGMGLPASPDSRFVDLTIEGQFLGNYLLTEKVEVKADRLELTDPSGILLELDNNYGLAEDFHFTTTRSNSLFVLKDAVGDVDPPLAEPLKTAYTDIQAYLNEFESYLYAPDPDWSKISAMIDVDSFIRYHFVFEVAENPEITQSSVFFWKDGPDDVLHAGPVWDFDSGFASYLKEQIGGSPSQDYVKNAQFLRNRGNGWYSQLFRNEEFVALVNQMYEKELEPLVDALPSNIDAYAAEISQSAEANFVEWDAVLGRPSIFVSGGRVVAPTWSGEVDFLRGWVAQRSTHLAQRYSAGMPTLKYAPHIANIGWQPAMTSGQIVGTQNRFLQVEALDIALVQNTLGGSLQSRAHVQNIGWTAWRTGNTRLGTTGRALQIEGLQFKLTGALAARYDVSYRANVEKLGWLPWVANGTTAGTTGKALQIEALQIRLLEKGDPAAGPSVGYRAHVASIGWMPEVADGAVAGTTGRSLAMQALSAGITNSQYSGGIQYRAHVQSIGWMAWTDSSQYIGTVGRNLRLEAVQIRLTGDLATHYSIRYRAHVQGVGWQPWVSNGATAGTVGQSKRAEAVRIELVPKP